jgi:hypothetical protein
MPRCRRKRGSVQFAGAVFARIPAFGKIGNEPDECEACRGREFEDCGGPACWYWVPQTDAEWEAATQPMPMKANRVLQGLGYRKERT